MLGAIKRGLLSVHDLLTSALLAPRLRWEWAKRVQPQPNERPIEYAFALEWITRLAPRRVLDVGCGRSSWPHLLATCGLEITAIDEVKGYWRGSLFNRHYHVEHDDITAPTTPGPFELVTCLSVLEHVPEHEKAVEQIANLLAPGGHLLLTCPYREDRYVEDVYRLPGVAYGSDFPFRCSMYSRAELDRWLADGRLELVEARYWRTFSGELWAFGERLLPPEPSSVDAPHQLGCFVLRRRDDGRPS